MMKIRRWSVAVLWISLFCMFGSGNGDLLAGSTDELNFQGELRDSAGNPLNGSYNLRFAIFDGSSVKIWPSGVPYEVHSQVNVVDGVFSVLLGSQVEPIHHLMFDSSDRYLEIGVCTSPSAGCVTFETMSPRQKMTTTGYAMCAGHFAPGLSMTDDDTLLNLTTTGTSGSAFSAHATASTGSATAIYGDSVSASGAGVAGYNSGSGYGVYGHAPSGYGVYSAGDTHVEGELTIKAKTGYVWVSAAAFVNVLDGDIDHGVNSIKPGSIMSETTVAVAPVSFPEGATLTKMTVYWFDQNTTGDGRVTLLKDSGASGMVIAAESNSNCSGSCTSVVTSFPGGAVVDNSSYGWIVSLALSMATIDDYVQFYAIKFEYTYTEL